MIHGLNSLIYIQTDVHLVLGRKENEDNSTAVHVGTNGVITMLIYRVYLRRVLRIIEPYAQGVS